MKEAAGTSRRPFLIPLHRASGFAQARSLRLAEFTLPKNSKITKGREWKPEEGKRLKTFKIYRYDPDSTANPRFDRYTIDLDKCGPMVLEPLSRTRSTRP